MIRRSVALFAALSLGAVACAPSPGPERPAAQAGKKEAKKGGKAKKPPEKGAKDKPAEPAGPVIVYTFQVAGIGEGGADLREKVDAAAKAAGVEVKADEVKDKGCQYVTFYAPKADLKPAPSVRLRTRSESCTDEKMNGWDLLVRYRSDAALGGEPPGKELGNSREEIVRAWDAGASAFSKDTFGWRYVTGRKEGAVTAGVPGADKDANLSEDEAVARRLPESIRPEKAVPQGKPIEAHRWSLGLVKIGDRFVEVAAEQWTCAGGTAPLATELTVRVPKGDEAAGQKFAAELGKLLEHDKNGRLTDDRAGECK